MGLFILLIMEEQNDEDFFYRTVIINVRQSKELSEITRKNQNTQTYFYNNGIISGLKKKPGKYDAGYAVTDMHNTIPWSNSFHTGVGTTAYQEGLDASDKHVNWCTENRKARIAGKKITGHNRNWHEGLKDGKPNNWTDRKSLLRHSKKDVHAAMSVNGQHPSLRKGKWKKLYMNLPGTGEVELLISFKKLEKMITITKDLNSVNKFYQTNIVSYRLVENTKKITSYTTDSNRTYKLHLSIRVPKPEKTDRNAVVGLDGGVKNTVTADDGTKCITRQLPADSVRSKNDEISKQQSKRDKHVYKSNRWCKENQKLIKMRKKLNNRRTEHENHIAKILVMMAGIIVLELLDIKSMISYNDWRKKGLNRAIHNAGMGRMAARIRMTAENMGTKILEIPPHYTSITCGVCNRINPHSRITRDLFKCVYCGFKCKADPNAAYNIRHFGLPCIRRFPFINRDGYYETENMKNVILANDAVIYDSVIGGGWDSRHETGESKPGLYRVDPKNNGDNQAVEDSLDCQKKSSGSFA